MLSTWTSQKIHGDAKGEPILSDNGLKHDVDLSFDIPKKIE